MTFVHWGATPMYICCPWKKKIQGVSDHTSTLTTHQQTLWGLLCVQSRSCQVTKISGSRLEEILKRWKISLKIMFAVRYFHIQHKFAKSTWKPKWTKPKKTNKQKKSSFKKKKKSRILLSALITFCPESQWHHGHFLKEALLSAVVRG